MRPDQNDFRPGSFNFDFDVMARPAIQLVSVPARLQASSSKRILNEIGGGVELAITMHVPLANMTSEHFNIRSQFVAELDFVRGQCGGSRNILARPSPSQPPHHRTTCHDPNT